MTSEPEPGVAARPAFAAHRLTEVALTLVVGLLAFVMVIVEPGCGGVHDASVGSVPLVTLHGHVDLGGLARTQPDAALLGALIWAAVPTVNPVCLPFPPRAELAAVCPDPYGVVAGEVSPGVPVDANGDFDLSILELPNLKLSVGDPATRVAYGSLIVFEDIDGNGKPSFPKAPARSNRRPFSLDATVVSADRIVAASFSSLRVPQRRIVFREGDFVSPSNFYPACLWTTDDRSTIPPPGFSILEVPPIEEPLPPPSACRVDAVETRLTLSALSPDDGLALMCRAVAEVESLVRQPQIGDAPSGEVVCLGPRLLATLFGMPRICPSLQSYALVGCGETPKCTVPEWDLTRFPPPWWTCR